MDAFRRCATAGLTLNADGWLSGSPAQSGSYSFTVTVTNTAGVDTRLFTVVVEQPITPPNITTTVMSNGAVGAWYSQQLAANGTAPMTWMHSAGALPPGLTLNADGWLSGSPAQSGSYFFTVTVTSTAGIDSRTFTLTVERSISAADGVSAWAVDEINEAIQHGIIPSDLLNNYQTNITRAVFCRTVVRMLMAKSQTVDNQNVFINAFGIDLNYTPFDDTSDHYIKIAYALGIVNGIGNRKFAPNNSITRQEAATMLSRAAAVFEFTSFSGTPINFVDVGAIAPWARSAVGFVSANGVMNGVGNDRFSPHGFYTVEMSFVTMLRLFNAFPRAFYSLH